MGTDKRARQKELHRTRAEQAAKAAAQAKRRKRIVNVSLIAALVALLAGLLTAVGGGDDDQADSTTTTAAADATTSTTAPGALQPATLTGPGPGESIDGETPCPKADGSSPRTTGFTQAPPDCIDEDKTYTATFDTTKGKMVVALDTEAAPRTVNNFVVLSRYRFYDGSPFFRIVKDFAAQAGDPSESPSNQAQFGYTIPDELPEAGAYEVGSLAMANTGSPDSGGAQFFFVTGEQGAGLPPSYSLFGQVTEGLDVLAAINAVPSVQTDQNDGAPTEQVTINSITITES